jgi:hypothetical protein
LLFELEGNAHSFGNLRREHGFELHLVDQNGGTEVSIVHAKGQSAWPKVNNYSRHQTELQGRAIITAGVSFVIRDLGLSEYFSPPRSPPLQNSRHLQTRPLQPLAHLISAHRSFG